MTIGTGKDKEEYGNVPYHLIDVCDAGKIICTVIYRISSTPIATIRKRRSACSLRRLGHVCGAAISGIVLPDVPENPDLRKKALHGKKPRRADTYTRRHGSKLHNTTDVDSVQRALKSHGKSANIIQPQPRQGSGCRQDKTQGISKHT